MQRRILKPDHPHTALSTYNLACVVTHEGKRVQALAMLCDAVDHGLATWIDLEIDKDPDLAMLHGDSHFQRLVSYARAKATGQTSAHTSLSQSVR